MSWLSNVNWNAVSAIAAVIATLIAFITVWHTLSIWKEQERSNRPYFIIEKPGISPDTQSRIQINFYNKGKRPAANFNGMIYFLNQKLDGEHYQRVEFSVGSDIPVDSPTPWYSDNVKLSRDMDPMYIVVIIKYGDPITREGYSQSVFMKWDGVTNGTFFPDFTYASIEERNKIRDWLKEGGKLI